MINSSYSRELTIEISLRSSKAKQIAQLGKMSFYRFNSFTGRLTQAAQNQALNPLAPNKLQSTEVPKLIYDSIKTKPVKTMPISRFQSTLRPELKTAYEKFQVDLTKPSYLLGGAKDKLIFRFCVLLTTLSFMNNVYFFYQLQKKF